MPQLRAGTVEPMCGRFVSSSSVEDIAEYFGVESYPEELIEREDRARANFNVAPTTDVLAVYTGDDQRRLDRFRWGLVPRWAKDLKIGNRMINARAETVATKNAFKPALARRRCILAVDGFYEWQKFEGSKVKQPMFIYPPDDKMFAFAGLWETWKVPPPEPEAGTEGAVDEAAVDEAEPQLLFSCTIITTSANNTMAPVHDRMPVLLGADDWDRWLDPDNRDIDALTPLLVPAPDDAVVMHPVSTEVNNARNRGAHLIERAEPVAR